MNSCYPGLLYQGLSVWPELLISINNKIDCVPMGLQDKMLNLQLQRFIQMYFSKILIMGKFKKKT